MLAANYEELSAKVAAYKDPRVYAELVGDFSNTSELTAYLIDVSRFLINFVSLSCGVRDSCRNLIRKHYYRSEFEKIYVKKIEDVFQKNELVAFIEEFRNYLLHYRLLVVILLQLRSKKH